MIKHYSNPSGARQPMDLQSLSTLVKYGSEVLLGYLPKKTSDLATRAAKPVREMPNRTIAAEKVVNELQMMVTVIPC